MNGSESVAPAPEGAGAGRPDARPHHPKGELHIGKPVVRTRRTFLERFTLGSLGALALTYVAGILAYLAPARKSKGADSLTDAGSIDEWPVGTAKVAQHGDHPVLVIRNETETVGFSAACTHLGCIVHYDPERKQILCPCHAAVFDLRGNVVSGPPPRPLPPVPVEVRDGHVYIGGNA